MSLLLLFGGSQAGTIQATVQTIVLTAATPTIAVGDVGIAVTPIALALSIVLPTIERGIAATPITLALAAPVAPLVAAGGAVGLAPAPIDLVFSSAVAAVSLDLTIPILTLDGVARPDILRASLSITDVLDEQPNTATFTIAGGPKPRIGAEFVVAVGVWTQREFGGHVTRVEQSYLGDRRVIRWQCEAIDYTRLLDRRLVVGQYGAQSASAIAIDLVSRFTSGFSTTHIASGLPEVDGIEFTFEQVTQALTRLAKLVGAYWYVDYDRSVHFFVTETVDQPSDISDAACDVRALDQGADLTQVRTRVWCEGYGSTAAADVGPDATAIPVEDAVYYADGTPGSGGLPDEASGWGLVAAGPQAIYYQGKDAGGATTLIRGADGPGPGTAPYAYVFGGGGGIIGTVYYRVTFRASQGETSPGPYSNGATGYPFPDPVGSIFVQALQNAAGLLVGRYRWCVTYVTAEGETLAGGGTGFVDAAAVSSSTAPWVTWGGPGPLVGQYLYAQTVVTANGESALGPYTARTAGAVARPGGVAVNQIANVWGHLRPGTYAWALTYETDLGETLLSPAAQFTIGSWSVAAPSVSSWANTSPGGGVLPGDTYIWAVALIDQDGGVSLLGSSSGSFQVSGSNPVVVVLNIPVGPSGTAGRRIYRKSYYGTGAWRWVGDQPDNVATQFTDRSPAGGADWQGGGTMGGQVRVTIPAADTSVVRRVHIYRSKVNNAGVLYRVGEVGSSTYQQYFDDSVPDDGLTDAAPLVSTAGGEALRVTIYAGPAGTTSRRLYRTKAGTTEYHLVTESQGNGTIDYVDATPDVSLTGAAPPAASAAGGQSFFLSNLPVGDAGTLARRIYRTKAGGAEFWLVTQISDNSTRTFVDNVADAALGAAAPLTHTAGAATVQVANIPIGPAWVVSRRLYRTKAGGGDFYYLAELDDNVTTSYLDDRADRELGTLAPATGTLGALPEETTIRVENPDIFQAGGGWVRIGSQLIRYTGVDRVNRTITGVPATGPGSITAPIRGGDDVVTVPMVLNVPGWGGIKYPIKRGDAVNVLVYADDAAAQAALAAAEGGDGIHEYLVQDNRLAIATCRTRARAELAQFATAEQRLTFTSRDPKLRSGKSVVVNLGPPTNIAGTFKIQQVVIDTFMIPGQLPLRHVTASSYLFSFEHLLRRVELMSGA